MSLVQAKLLTYAQDVGGARLILPVIHRLLEDNSLAVSVLANGKAASLLGNSGLPVSCFVSRGSSVPLTISEGTRLMDELAPDVVFAATSHPKDPTNGRLIAAARSMDIPTIAVLDHWKGRERFAETAEGSLVFAPELLGVMDQETRWAYVAAGMAPNRVCIVGHPYLEQIARDRDKYQATGYLASLRQRAGLDPSRPVILFCSEFVHDHSFHDPCAASCIPLSQVRVGPARLIDVVLKAAESLGPRMNLPFELALRPHPNEPQEPIPGMRIIDQDAMSDVEAVAMASVVVGAGSMPLIEAAVLGKPAASLAFFDDWHPSRVFYDLQAWDAQPFFSVLGSPEELAVFLSNVLDGCGSRSLPSDYAEELLCGAADRCVSLLQAGLALPRAHGLSAR